MGGQSNQVLSEVLRAGRESTAGLSPLSTPDSILICYVNLGASAGAQEGHTAAYMAARRMGQGKHGPAKAREEGCSTSARVLLPSLACHGENIDATTPLSRHGAEAPPDAIDAQCKGVPGSESDAHSKLG